jgi:hypothetical protein
LEGEELKSFGDYYANCVSVDRVPRLYLWTEKGALLQAKSLNTDKAWEMYENLVDDYYRRGDELVILQEENARLSNHLHEMIAQLEPPEWPEGVMHREETFLVDVLAYRANTALRQLVEQGRSLKKEDRDTLELFVQHATGIDDTRTLMEKAYLEQRQFLMDFKQDLQVLPSARKEQPKQLKSSK